MEQGLGAQGSCATSQYPFPRLLPAFPLVADVGAVGDSLSPPDPLSPPGGEAQGGSRQHPALPPSTPLQLQSC